MGYRLDEILNDITGETPASFEPTIDYVVTKIPRWAFEKLPGAHGVLGTQMQSVGEVMAIGRVFSESFQKALRSLETGRQGFDPGDERLDDVDTDEVVRLAAVPTADRPFVVAEALDRGVSVERLHEVTGIDPWFLDQLHQIIEERTRLAGMSLASMTRADWRAAKRMGFGDGQLARLWTTDDAPVTGDSVRDARLAAGVRITYKTVDTCAAEFAASTPYHYGTYEDDDEVAPFDRPAVVILGSGPNRIGQGVEFDYCCVHAAFALSDAGYETVMVNCNPETVSTDYDTSDRLFFEPLTVEGVRNVCDALADAGELAGVVVALGGQTPLKLAGALEAAGIPILGTSPASIDLAEDREEFNALCERLGIPQPPGGTAATVEAAQAIATGIGYPVLVRPSYVLGGRAMQIVYDADELAAAMAELTESGTLGREGGLSAERPALVDRFLEDAIEVDVDAIRDSAGEVLIGGVMEHIEEAGVHSGDSACAIPPPSLPAATVATIEAHTRALAEALDVCGLLNVQYAVKDAQVHIIEANPRASRTVPFVSKATGVPLAKVASRVMLGDHPRSAAGRGVAPSPGRRRSHRGEGSGAAVQQVPRGRHRLGARDALHGRGHGDRSQLRTRVREEPGRGRLAPPRAGNGVPLAREPRQGGRSRGGPEVRRAGVPDRGDGRNRGRVAGRRAARRAGRGQGRRGGRNRRGRAPRVGQGRPGGQHPAGSGAARRRDAHPPGRDRPRGPVPHHGRGRARRRVGHRRVRHPRGRRALPAGVPPRRPDAPRRMTPPAPGPLWRRRYSHILRRRRRTGSFPEVDTTVRLGSVELANPIVAASGTFGHGDEVARVCDPSRLGAVTVKSLAPYAWPGNPPPRLRTTASGMLNSVGLEGPGVEHWVAHELPLLLARGARVIASVWGRTVDDFALAAKQLGPALDDLLAVEVNVSCPNVEDRARMFAHSTEATRAAIGAVVAEVGATPVFAKLSPNTWEIVDIAGAAIDAGATGLTLVNTLLGLAIDADARVLALGGGGGGLSGPAIKPVALRAVHEVTRVHPGVPVIGTGGIASGLDAVEMLLAGATAVGVGTITFREPRAMLRIVGELVAWCSEQGVAKVSDLTGGLR